MTDAASADIPLAIDRVDHARGDGDGVSLRLTGRWLRAADAAQSDPLLVVQVQGRRHRFAAAGDGDEDGSGVGPWEATFTLPSWAEPQREGQAALWVGTSVVPVPLPGSASAPVPEHSHRPPPPPALGEARAWPPPPGAWPPGPPSDGSRPGELPEPAVDTGRTGPLAELLFKESVSALHAELEQRSNDVARLQGSLADTQSELEARTAMQAALEAAHNDLRGELQELMSAVTVQREDYEKRLAGAEDQRASAEAECTRAAEQVAELTAARDALGAEVADLRRHLATAQLGHQQHAADLSALRDQLAAAQVSRDAAIGEVAGLRTELERLGSELAVTREHHAAQGGDLGEAQRLLAEARSLSEQLRSQSSQ